MMMIRNRRIWIAHVIGHDTSSGVERKKYGYPAEYRVSLSSVSGELETRSTETGFSIC